MAPRECPHTRGSRGRRHTLQPGPGPGPGPPRVQAGTVLPPGRRLEPGTHKPRPKKIIFEDELPLRTTKKPISGVLRPGELSPVPDYELRYPPLSSPQERQRYAAVFKDQHPELVALQQEVGAALATLQRLEALLGALPPPRTKAEAQLTARVRRELQKKQADPRLLARQAHLRQLHAKLRLIKTHIQKFDATQDKGSVYF